MTGLRLPAVCIQDGITNCGIIPPPRRVNGQRHYDASVLTRIAVIRMAQEAGFTIEEVKTLISGFPDGTPASARWQALALRKLTEVDALIARAQAMRRVLEESLACGCLSLETCAAAAVASSGS